MAGVGVGAGFYSSQAETTPEFTESQEWMDYSIQYGCSNIINPYLQI